MKINQFTVNPFGENVYIVWSEITHNAVVIDPGMMTEDGNIAVRRTGRHQLGNNRTPHPQHTIDDTVSIMGKQYC